MKVLLSPLFWNEKTKHPEVRKLLLQWQTWDVNLTFGFQPGALPPTVPPWGLGARPPEPQGFHGSTPTWRPAVQQAPGQGKRELWGTRHLPGLLLSLFLPLWMAGALPGAAEQAAGDQATVLPESPVL